MVQPPLRNQIYVEFQDQLDGKLTAELSLEQPVKISGMSLFLRDLVQEVRINGQMLTIVPQHGGFEVNVPEIVFAIASKLTIGVSPLEGGEGCPIAFLRGQFAVISQDEPVEKDEHQWMLKGAFKLVPMPASIDGANLISAGFPFAGLPITVSKTIQMDEKGITTLQLTDVKAAAAHVWLAGEELGWCWGPDFQVPIPKGLTAGSYELKVNLYPSTFNMYGPHRHIDGDRYLTSPDQYKGIKNFADRADAPELTKVIESHFVKWGISGDVRLIHQK
ncbi:hypothetical protein QFZ81_005823 [Paenibacillus sp. V4I9]|uniref:hypothetical protein n=1 Tax=Paenibacillus sp. V4I9 TaxID=3042308 RepID=UPI002781FF73|nr:hypothetical protein [Paenibacillus sp. V4I9]MDQ0890735.1 hypothetical protein [Paenibacillus sp. V4I9]